jgi:hypothetical protein
MAKDAFLGEPGKQHPHGGHVLLDRGRRGLALQDLDVRGDRDRFNVFEVLISGSFRPGKKLLDCPVVGGSRVSVPDRDRKELKEFFASGWPGAGDDCRGWKRIY